jgi:hypothetical protein
MYSRAQAGWHDEPFEYVFSFEFDFGAPISVSTQADLLSQPLQFEPDADFYCRSIAQLVDQAPSSVDRIDFDMRLRDSFGRPLDQGFIPMAAYAITPIGAGPFPAPAGAPVGTPIYPELFCPKSSVMQADFQAQGLTGRAPQFYSFHLYLQGVKRFPNEICE